MFIGVTTCGLNVDEVIQNGYKALQNMCTMMERAHTKYSQQFRQHFWEFIRLYCHNIWLASLNADKFMILFVRTIGGNGLIVVIVAAAQLYGVPST